MIRAMILSAGRRLAAVLRRGAASRIGEGA